MVYRLMISTLKQAKRLIVIVIGFTVLLIGVALIVLPGPAFLVIPLGLAILGTELLWARRLLKRMKEKAAEVTSRVSGMMR
ncbi:MAG TPA: PGPGW domain-containing protein [Nitrospiria bacterium]|nr:PGPGW domain-containing protein [Nitrospiria bacterium]